ncbi:MAG TPA: ribonuclease domain-containing protein [Elusimicrobiales bacterium]|nr:ribonuclease domain-containing protein [Elusimicrobiales bacterium]
MKRPAALLLTLSLLLPMVFAPAFAAGGNSAVEQLLGHPAAPSAAELQAPEPVLIPLKPSARDLQPGSSILPVIEDRGRVEAILELVALISRGGPFPFKEDHKPFKNKEGLLPAQPLGFYKEYTLLVPKDSSRELVIGGVLYHLPPSYGVRGCERLVVGGGEIVYYSPTHYKDFIRLTIVP